MIDLLLVGLLMLVIGYLVGTERERRTSHVALRRIALTAMRASGETAASPTVQTQGGMSPEELARIEQTMRINAALGNTQRDTFEREPEPDQSVVKQEQGAADFSEKEIEAGMEQLTEMYILSEQAPPDNATLRQHAMQLLAGEPVEGSQ